MDTVFDMAYKTIEDLAKAYDYVYEKGLKIYGVDAKYAALHANYFYIIYITRMPHSRKDDIYYKNPFTGETKLLFTIRVEISNNIVGLYLEIPEKKRTDNNFIMDRFMKVV